MITENYLDISNYTGVLTAEQVAFIDANYSGVVIGLQNASIARQQQAQLQSVDRAYYVDLPGRDLTIPETNAYVFIDIEAGCFQSQRDVVYQIARIQTAGCRVGIYGNTGGNSIPAVMGNANLSQWPLWYANYQLTPPESPTLPTPFNGWTECMMWQWSDKGVAGITADLNVLFVADPAPVPPPRTLTHTISVYDDGSVEIA